MNIEEFKESYIKRNGLSHKEFDKYLFVTTCNCGDDTCQGFAVFGEQYAKEIKEFLVDNEFYKKSLESWKLL